MSKEHPDLFDYDFYNGTPPAQAHSITSTAAAVSMKPRIGELHRRIVRWLRERRDGATDEEMQDGMEMPANTQRPRRRELYLDGQIEDSGKTRTTRSGRQAVVWRLAS